MSYEGHLLRLTACAYSSSRRNTSKNQARGLPLSSTDAYFSIFPFDVLKQLRLVRLLLLSIVAQLIDVLQSNVLNSTGVPYPTPRRGHTIKQWARDGLARSFARASGLIHLER